MRRLGAQRGVIAVTAAASYAVERRRGWTEAAGTPARGDNDLWDEKRAATLRPSISSRTCSPGFGAGD